MMNILITGAAGFIGFHLSQRLLSEGYHVWGVDNLNSYYDVALKYARLKRLKPHPNFQFVKLELSDREAVADLFANISFDSAINLAAQAGVRYSIHNPAAYIDSNLVGFANVLEGCRHSQISHLVYASSSSVYGANTKVPFSTTDPTDTPVSLYAATKKSNELLAHSYSHLYNIPTTGLRFFTVYGPWGRPDMAYFKFTRAIAEGDPIDVYNFGKMRRDFTFIDDIVEGIVRVLRKPPKPNTESVSRAPYKLYNLGNNNPVELGEFIEAVECALGRSAVKRMLPLQAGDVIATYADVDDLYQDVGFKPNTPLNEGIQRFVRWYCNFYDTSLATSTGQPETVPAEVT